MDPPPNPPTHPPCQLIHQLTHWQTHSQTNTHTHSAYVHTHTTCAFSPQPCPLENSDLTELEVRSATRVIYSFPVHFDDIFTFFFFSVEYHCASNYFKRSCKMTNVKKKKKEQKIWITDLWLTEHPKSWTHLQFLSECRAAPHCYFVPLLTFWKYQLADFQTETNKQKKKLCFVTFLWLKLHCYCYYFLYCFEL